VNIPEGVPIQEEAHVPVESYKDKEELTDLTQVILAQMVKHGMPPDTKIYTISRLE